MTGPTFAPVDADTGSLLDLLADDQRKADDWETCTDTRGRNAGRPQRLRRWVG